MQARNRQDLYSYLYRSTAIPLLVVSRNFRVCTLAGLLALTQAACVSDVTSDLNLQSNNSASSSASDLAQNSDSTQNAQGDSADAEDSLDATDPPDLLVASPVSYTHLTLP